MPSPVSEIHADPHFYLTYWLGTYANTTPGTKISLASTWLMAGESAPQPDLALRIRPEYGGISRIEGGYPSGAPELVIEISHTTTAQDTGAKLKLYERNGVEEYLIVQPTARRAVWRRLVNGAYDEIAAEADGTLRSQVFPGLWLDCGALWREDMDGLLSTVQAGLAGDAHAAFVARLAATKSAGSVHG